MKILALLAFSFAGSAAQASYGEHWNCNGGRGLEHISFDLKSGMDNFTVVASNLDQKDLKKLFIQSNAFTMSAMQVLDVRAQETIDYTIVMNRGAHTLTIFSQWSTNNEVDSEVVDCAVK